MEIYLGNIQFDEIESKLGYKLNDDDLTLWNKYHCDNAELKDDSFHVFDIPRCIVFKGVQAMQAIKQMFTPDKLTNAIGKFMVYEQK